MRIGLRLGRVVGGPRRAQVAEARRRDRADAVWRERSRKRHALVVASAAAVDHQQRDPLAHLLNLDRAATRGQHDTALRGVAGGAREVAPDPCVGHGARRAQRDGDREHHAVRALHGDVGGCRGIAQVDGPSAKCKRMAFLRARIKATVLPHEPSTLRWISVRHGVRVYTGEFRRASRTLRPTLTVAEPGASAGRFRMAVLKWAAIAITLLVVAGGVLVWLGNARWDAATRDLQARLEASRSSSQPARYFSRELEGLPEPVQCYFRGALTEGQAIVTAVDVVHAGTFNLSESGEWWRPFRSRQRVVTRRPGFVWDGRVAMLPGLAVRVHDAYIAGEGILHPALLGLFTLTDLRGTGEVAQGELMRFLAEAAWYPTVLLPSQGVTWEPIDAASARATLRDGDIELTMTFGFDAEGMIRTVRAQARGRMVSGQVVPTPWEGRWSNVQRHAGMRVPMTGEVAWLTPQGRKPYWRGTIASLDYEFAN